MSRALRVAVDASRISPSAVIRESAGLAPLTMISGRMLIDLSDELGGQEEAVAFLSEIAEQTGRPVGVNVPTLEGSRSMFLAPRGWTQERLAGWVAGHHEAVEDMFGPATVAEGSPVSELDSTITLHGRPIRIRYRPDVGRDIEFQAAFARAERARRAGAVHAIERYRQLAVRCIEAWDLEDEDGQPMPIQERTLEGLPIGALQRIIGEATDVARRSPGER